MELNYNQRVAEQGQSAGGLHARGRGSKRTGNLHHEAREDHEESDSEIKSEVLAIPRAT